MQNPYQSPLWSVLLLSLKLMAKAKLEASPKGTVAHIVFRDGDGNRSIVGGAYFAREGEYQATSDEDLARLLAGVKMGTGMFPERKCEFYQTDENGDVHARAIECHQLDDEGKPTGGVLLLISGPQFDEAWQDPPEGEDSVPCKGGPVEWRITPARAEDVIGEHSTHH